MIFSYYREGDNAENSNKKMIEPALEFLCDEYSGNLTVIKV